jgi:transposase
MISSVRLDGTTACMTIDGATNTEVFQAYVREILVPTLRAGDIVVLDNLGAHKNDATLALITAAGAEPRFLPPYSPDLNPIEMMWSKVKALLRAAGARTHSALLQAIARALAAVSTEDAKHWFAHCGYRFT